MGKSSDQLREEIDAQRSDAGAKIDHLQEQLQTQVEDTKTQVTDTASHVREEAQAMVTDTVDTVKQSVQDMDFERYIQERPLMSVGAAMMGGFLLGALLGGDDHRSRQYSGNYSSQPDTHYQSHTGGGMGESLRSAAKKSGLEETLSNAGAALMGSVTEQLKEMVDRQFPGFSNKLDTAQHQSGSFTEKTRAAQQEAQQQ